MNWHTVVEAIGIFGVGCGLLTWLIQSVAKQALDRDLEAFKHGLRKTHEIEMEEAKNRFTVGATSHMANVAFDKHVQFCEKYTAEVKRAVAFLFSRGADANVLQHANALMDAERKGFALSESRMHPTAKERVRRSVRAETSFAETRN